MKRPTSLLPLAVAAIFPFISVQACGPYFSDDVFVRKLGADHFPQFAAGKLGVLLPTYNRLDLAMAYRYLNGGTLSDEEQKSYTPPRSFVEQAREAGSEQANQSADPTNYNEPAGPADLWLDARGRYAPPHPEVHPVKQFNVVYRAGFFLAGEYMNCQADAFRTAVNTLENRAKTWGPHSPELADWIRAQDAVFSNCGGTGQAFFYPESDKPVIHPAQPSDAPATAPLLLRQDRVYQQAAAHFYAAQFAPSRSGFQAIAQDSASPWHDIARYLIARTLIRESFLKANKDGSQEGMADFDPSLMKQAQHELESVRTEKLHGISPQGIQQMLNFVRLRTEPEERLGEISSALAGPKPDPDYKQDLEDLNWYLNNKLDSAAIREDFNLVAGDRPPSEFEKAFNDADDLSSTAPLIDWLITFQSPSESAKKHAIVQSQHHTGSLPWLLAALAKATSEDPQATSLIDAAAHISPSSPAWPTVTYHRLRLLIETGHATDARKELESDFPQIQSTGSESAVNLFTGLRMRTGPTLDAALADAPRRILERNSQQQMALDECLDVVKNPKRNYDCKEDKSPVEFSEDAVAIFNNALPLDTLAQAAQSRSLPSPLNQSVAEMTWVRAVLLKNGKIAAEMLPLLPQKLQQQAGSGTEFHAQLAILRNPGLRPFLDAGVQRSASWDFVESYADNWWCGKWTTIYSSNPIPVHVQSVAFLTPALRTAGEKETHTLLALGSADEYLGSQVLDYARSHPDDHDTPEALYLTLRMIRYGCYHSSSDNGANKPDDRVASIAREVGALMRQSYSTNPWTKKAAPYVWPAK